MIDLSDEKPTRTREEPRAEPSQPTSTLSQGGGLPAAQTAAKASEARRFPGFDWPDQSWSKLPHSLIEALPIIDTVGELKVILYVLRHTWGYQEFGINKRITLDEFQKGRKRSDGSRMDDGTGLSLNAIKLGVKRAVAHGFLVQEVELHRDRGRRSHAYRLRMSISDTRVSESDTLGIKDGYPDYQILTPRVSNSDTRSEKETAETNSEEKLHGQAAASSAICPIHGVPMKLRTKDGDHWYSHRLPDGTWCRGVPGNQSGNGNRRGGQSNKVTTVICPSCSLVRASECICPNCGKCSKCCECAESNAANSNQLDNPERLCYSTNTNDKSLPPEGGSSS